MNYRYYKFETISTRISNAAVQISELVLRYNNVRVNYASAVASNPGGSNPSGETPSKAIDNDTNTKWLDHNKKPLIIDFGINTLANSYTFATANDVIDRDPISWKLYGSLNNIDYILLDNKINFETTTARYTYQTNFQCPTITNFSIPTKTFGGSPFTIPLPTSNSSGGFVYSSSNLSVATIYENIITIVGAGTSNILATQLATSNYTLGTIETTFQVNQSTPTNPVIIDSDNELLYFMNTSLSSYGNIINSFEIDYTLISTSYKVLTSNSSSVIITKKIY